jgi:CUB/sushi domain-containing protein
MRLECNFVAIPVIQCEDPPMVAHAEAKINGYLPGDVVTYTCIPGYKLSGSEAMECVLGGTWEGSPPVCISK